MEALGRIQGDLHRLKADLLSENKARRMGVMAEVIELREEIAKGKIPIVRGALKGTDQPTYEVKARTEPFQSQKNAENFFADRIKKANQQFVGENSKGRLIINLGEIITLEGQPISRETARSLVKKVLAKGSRGTNITEVVVKNGLGEVIYQGLGD